LIELVQRDKVAAVAALARDHRITVAVDDVRNVDQLARAAEEAGSRLEILIELDVGMGRCGVRTKEETLALAERIATHAALSLRGIQAYEGHCMLEPDPELRAAKQARALNELVAVVDHLEDPAWLTGTLKSMGDRHKSYGVSAEMYPWVGECLLATLAEVAGKDWSPALAAAWTEAYGAISGLMLEGTKA
jgi:hypothetical protein